MDNFAKPILCLVGISHLSQALLFDLHKIWGGSCHNFFESYRSNFDPSINNKVNSLLKFVFEKSSISNTEIVMILVFDTFDKRIELIKYLKLSGVNVSSYDHTISTEVEFITFTKNSHISRTPLSIESSAISTRCVLTVSYILFDCLQYIFIYI